jgi:hypothetical protein
LLITVEGDDDFCEEDFLYSVGLLDKEQLMIHHHEYQVIVNESGQLLCEKCGTPLPLEPQSFRRTFTISGFSEPGWFVWRCPNPLCRAVNIRHVDNVADIERNFDTICC